MNFNNSSEKTSIRAIISTELKEEVNSILKQNGLTYSKVIQDLFLYIAETGEIPFEQIKIVVKK